MRKPLTRRQQEVLEFIRAFQAAKGYAPTLDEIRRHLGLGSNATVHKHLSGLETKGVIQRDWNRTRSLALTPDDVTPPSPHERPLLGVVAAGCPIEAVETPESIAVPPHLLRGDSTFVLRVRGDSMIDEQIADGDLIVVEPREVVRDGELVVALVGDAEATLKRLYREGAMIRLQPSNAAMAPIMTPADQVKVQGVVVGLMRRY